MKGRYTDTFESWAWRMLMPALLVGGNAAGITLFCIAVLRLWSWRRHHAAMHWGWREGSQWWVVYFMLQVLGGLWSDDLASWALSLEVKSALWFLPVLVAMPGQRVARDFWWSVGWSVTVYVLWRIMRAGWHELVLDNPREWRYARFTGDVHPTYLGLHATVALLGLGRTWAMNVHKVLLWLMTAVIGIALGLSGSKAGILAAVAVVVLQLVLLARARRGASIAGVSTGRSHGPRLLVFVLVVLASGWWMSSARFAEMGSAAQIMTQEDAPVQSSSAGRIIVWQSSLEIIRDHPFGVGTGDVVPELMQLYARDGVDYALERRLNPHNQWLQAGVAFGWPGMVVFTLALLSCIRTAWRNQDELLLLGVVLVALHASVESVLEVQRGVVFILWMLMAVLPVVNEGRA